jgi:tetratricopeptide (TPR) repeat protein
MGLFSRADPQKLVNEGMALLQAERPQEALAKFQEATRLAPGHAQAWYCMGTIYAGQNDHEQAVECYRQSVQSAPPSHVALPLFNMGVALQAWGKIDKAIEVYKMTTKAAPDMADAWINLGRLLDDSGKHQEAIRCCDTALKLEPEDAMAWGNRGNSLRALRRFKEALESYRKARSLDEDDFASQVGIGVCLAQLGDPAKGLPFLDECVKKSGNPVAMVERATVLVMLKRYDEALQAIDAAIKAGERKPPVWNNRGEILVKLGRGKDSLRSFDEALKQDARYAPALFGKARVYFLAKRFAEAKEFIEKYHACAAADDLAREQAEAMLKLCQANGA